MKLEKKHWVIIGVVAIIVIWYFFFRRPKAVVTSIPQARPQAAPNWYSKADESGYNRSLKVALQKPILSSQRAGGSYDMCLNLCASMGQNSAFCKDWCAPFSTIDEGGDDGITLAKRKLGNIAKAHNINVNQIKS